MDMSKERLQEIRIKLDQETMSAASHVQVDELITALKACQENRRIDGMHNSAIRDQVADLQAELAEARKSTKEIIDDYETELANIHDVYGAEINGLKLENMDMETKADNLASDCADLRKEPAEAETWKDRYLANRIKTNKLQVQVQEQQAEVERLEQSNSKLQCRITENHTMIIKLRGEIDSYRNPSINMESGPA